MSLEFSIRANCCPSFRDVVHTMAVPDLMCAEATTAGSEWPAEPLHFHRCGISCREIRVAREGDAFRVRIPAFAAPEDFEFAIRLTESLAEHCGSSVETEEGDTLFPSRLRDVLNAGWIRERVESCAEKLFAMVRQEQGCYQIPGPVRSFYIGPRVLSELAEGAGAESLSARLTEAIRRVQYAYEDTHFAASVMGLTVKGTEGETTASAWGEGLAYLFAPVDYLVVEGDRSTFVPFASLPDVAGDRFAWLDERQARVAAAEADAWQAILRRAEQFASGPNSSSSDR